MDINKALGLAVKEHRRRAKKTQAVIDYDQGGLSKVENGKQYPSPESFVKIAEQLGSTVSAIWATAEQLAKSAKTTPARTNPIETEAIKSALAAERQAAYLGAISKFVEAVIATTPSARQALRAALSAQAAHASDVISREAFAHLANRVATARSGKPAKSGAARARVGGGSKRGA